MLYIVFSEHKQRIERVKKMKHHGCLLCRNMPTKSVTIGGENIRLCNRCKKEYKPELYANTRDFLIDFNHKNGIINIISPYRGNRFI